jgi:hypothetical protein
MHLRLEFIRSTNRGGGDCTHHERFRPARTRPQRSGIASSLGDGKFGEESTGGRLIAKRVLGFCSQLAGEVVWWCTWSGISCFCCGLAVAASPKTHGPQSWRWLLAARGLSRFRLSVSSNNPRNKSDRDTPPSFSVKRL